jgi:hypothetical protein
MTGAAEAFFMVFTIRPAFMDRQQEKRMNV